MNRWLTTLVVLAALFGHPRAALARWTRLTTDHVTFVGGVPERTLRDIALHLEQFRDVVGHVGADAAARSPVPTVVVVFEGDRSFGPFKPVFNGRVVDVSGYFVGTEDVNYIAVNAAQEQDAYRVIFHEYAHFLIANAIGPAPAWASEGLAEFYQTLAWQDAGTRTLLGAPTPQNLQLLRAAPTLLSLDALRGVTHDSPLYNEGDRRVLFYAQSWALIHYLALGAPARVGQLTTFLTSIATGTPEPLAFRAAFGSDTALLERELSDYVRSARFPATRITVDARLGRGGASVGEAIDDDEASGYLGDMLARLNRAGDARAYLQRTLDRNPAAARALAALGSLDLRAGQDAEALALLERSAERAPGVASIQGMYGRALTRRADRGGADADALYARARVVLERARALEPQNVSTMVTLAEVEMASGADSPRALALMQQALAASPARDEYRLLLAQAQALNGDYDGASATLDQLVMRTARSEIRDAATRLRARVADAREQARTLAPGPTLPSRAGAIDAVPGTFSPK